MSDAVERLIGMVPPPTQPVDAGSAEQWPAVEARLGVTLPADYKRLVNVYGAGLFADWVRVFSPFSEPSWLASPDLIGSIAGGTEQWKAGPPALFPESGGLLPFAQDDNGNLFCWQTAGPPHEWTVINFESHFIEDYTCYLGCGTTAWLAGWFAGDITAGITGEWYPEDVEPTEHRFFTPDQT